MLCVRLESVKAGLGPAVGQEDRRGSRWVCLDLTISTPLYPTGLFQPACLAAEPKKVSRIAAFVLVLPSREDRHKPRTMRALPKQNLAHRLVLGCANAPASVLELVLFPGPLLSLQLYPPQVLSACLLFQPNQHFDCFSGNVLTFSGIWSHYDL